MKKSLQKFVSEDFGEIRGLTLINESGLYNLIFSSKLPAAKDFKRWITSEVLPSIRTTGVYVNDKKYLKWLETREHGKISRRDETDAIKLFIEYARKQGCTWKESKFYSRLSVWSNISAGIPIKNGRDDATTHQLNIIDLIEGTVVKNVLIDGMAAGLHYTQIWACVKIQINSFLEATFQVQKLLH